MAGPTSIAIANNATLKRSFTAITLSSPPSPDLSGISKAYWGIQSTQRAREPLAQAPVVKRRDLSGRRKMPSAAGTRMYENHIPSFMSVYGMDSNIMDGSALGGTHTKLSVSPYNNQQSHQNPEVKTDSNLLQIHSHQHRESTSTQASDSTDSSPTTTVSTVDSSSLSDPSPSSSPESPITLVPLSSFTGSSFGLESFRNLKMGQIDTRPPPITVERPMTSPSPRKKNPKSLALNLRPSIDEFTSEPSSPSFIKPPPLKARKKPSILSLNTGTASMTLEPLGQQGMSSMLQRRSLKHSVSSPQMLSMTTPGFGPSGGMTLGDPSRGFGGSRLKESGPPRDTFTINEDEAPSPTGVQMATRAPGMSIGGDSFDRPPTGEDCKSSSYPDGPILMHEPTIHLYSEPKMEEAAEFDVVINVAREVKNPFEAKLEAIKREKEEKQKRLSHTNIETGNNSADPYAEIPGTAGTISSFQTAYETQPAGSDSSSAESSPSTPRPSTSEMKIPEYIHIPWDHNTDVKDELWDLCQTIESRAKGGKRVLVHCQQGASRSATLIIAYGMYINQDLSANEAYNLAQSKSRWVNPNMSLLFSLNDFKKIIERKKMEKRAAENKNMVIRNKSMTKHRQSLSASDLDTASSPGRARVNSSPISPRRDPAAREPVVMRTAPAKNSGVKEEASSDCNSAIDRLSRFDFGFGDIPPIEPFTEFEDSSKIERLPPQEDKWQLDMMSPRPQDDDAQSDIMSPRITEMTRNPLEHAFSRGIPQESSNGTPSLFSPRGFDFQRTTFFSPTVEIHPNLPPAQDPRSPPITGEATITRSIDDFL
ncbi:tyrosine/serine/threonine protein phosphatase [Ciborinia camelliae]|nr:tyrosine/serine/threonine protein phosphatase [Ciborinia camelliae]